MKMTLSRRDSEKETAAKSWGHHNIVANKGLHFGQQIRNLFVFPFIELLFGQIYVSIQSLPIDSNVSVIVSQLSIDLRNCLNYC